MSSGVCVGMNENGKCINQVRLGLGLGLGMGVGFFFNCHSSIPSYNRHLHRPNHVVLNSLSPSDQNQNQNQNHYEVLSVSRSATSQDIKKAFRLLARKYHPDVSKDSQGADAFKTVRRAYEVLTDEVTRAQYDRALKLQESNDTRYRGKWYYTPDFEERSKIYRWGELKQKIQYERYQKYKFETGSSHIDEDEREGSTDQLRSSFVEVLKTTFLALILLQTFGAQLSLTFSSLVALLDRKLDAGYKIAYLIAWILGGRAGVLLTLCLSVASWVCGKSSSSVVAVVVMAMWVGTNLARYAPLPQGAVLTLLYMSIKLQADLN